MDFFESEVYKVAVSKTENFKDGLKLVLAGFILAVAVYALLSVHQVSQTLVDVFAMAGYGTGRFIAIVGTAFESSWGRLAGATAVLVVVFHVLSYISACRVRSVAARYSESLPPKPLGVQAIGWSSSIRHRFAFSIIFLDVLWVLNFVVAAATPSPEKMLLVAVLGCGLLARVRGRTGSGSHPFRLEVQVVRERLALVMSMHPDLKPKNVVDVWLTCDEGQEWLSAMHEAGLLDLNSKEGSDSLSRGMGSASSGGTAWAARCVPDIISRWRAKQQGGLDAGFSCEAS